jgi:hypothetical protein
MCKPMVYIQIAAVMRIDDLGLYLFQHLFKSLNNIQQGNSVHTVVREPQHIDFLYPQYLMGLRCD